MKYAILILVPPKDTGVCDDEDTQRFQKLVRKLSSSKTKTKGVEGKHPHVWQIPLQSDLAFLAECIAEAKEAKVPLRVWFADESPGWIDC
jgi:hypothetical protein